MAAPSLEQLQNLERIEANYEVALRDGAREMVWSVKRQPNPDSKRIRIAPGLTGRIVAWGDGTWETPTIAWVKTIDVGLFLKRCREQIAQLAGAPR